MRHLNDTRILRLAAGGGSPEATASEREHLAGCAACRERVEAETRIWALLGTADPAARLDDRPLWPRVAAALDAGRAPAGAPVLRPRWRVGLAEAAHRPLAYAVLLLALAGLVGGNVAGRAVWSGAGASAAADTGAGTELVDYTALAGLPEGSLTAQYLGGDLAGESTRGASGDTEAGQ